MTRVELSIDLPDRLASDARDAGLLAPATIKSMLEAAVRQKAAERIGEAATRGQVAGEEPMSLAELQRIVDSVRKQKD